MGKILKNEFELGLQKILENNNGDFTVFKSSSDIKGDLLDIQKLYPEAFTQTNINKLIDCIEKSKPESIDEILDYVFEGKVAEGPEPTGAHTDIPSPIQNEVESEKDEPAPVIGRPVTQVTLPMEKIIKKHSANKLTRFEKARIIGARALQISYGAPVLVDYPKDLIDPIDVAMVELEQGMIPISVKYD